jgi:hypothetical protein
MGQDNPKPKAKLKPSLSHPGKQPPVPLIIPAIKAHDKPPHPFQKILINGCSGKTMN